MRAFLTVLLVVSTVIAMESSCWGVAEQQPAPSIYYKPLPSGMAEELTHQLKGFAKRYPCPPDDRAKARQLAIRYGRLPGSGHAAALRKIGPCAIPAIVELLDSQDDMVRHKALMSLELFLKPREYRKSGDSDVESLLKIVFHRALYDRSRNVRGSGIGYFGSEEHRAPKEANIWLTEVMEHDPDPVVRKWANETLQDWGFVPRDPNREWID